METSHLSFIPDDETSVNRILFANWVKINKLIEPIAGNDIVSFTSYRDSPQYQIDRQKFLEGTL